MNHLINDKYSIKEVTDFNEFEKLREVWNTLAKKQNFYAPFLTHEWFNLWLKHFLHQERLFILLLCYRRDPIAIAPFLIRHEKFKGIKIRKLELIGNVYSPIRNFVGFDANYEKRKVYVLKILGYLYNTLKHWDVIDLHPLAEEGATFRSFIDAVTQAGYRNAEYISFKNWYQDQINSSGKEYLGSLSKNLRKNIRKRTRLLNEVGELEFKVVREFQELEHYIDWYYKVYSKSWKKREAVGPVFHRELARLACRKGWLRLGFLLLNNKPIATKFVIVHKGVGYFLKSAYDFEYAKFGPGSILSARMLEYLIDFDNICQVDYGEGEESYKEQWVSKIRTRKGILIFNRNLKGIFLAMLMAHILPVFRQKEILRKLKSIVSRNILKSPSVPL
jgi:hypothetical protein